MSPAGEAQALEAIEAEKKKKQQHQQQLQAQSYMEKGVMLEPFVHQVGGHSCVLRFGDQTICKPLIPREHQFYKSLPAAMRRFTPQYRGVVSVSFEEDHEGNLCLFAYPLRSDPTDLENKDPLTDNEPKTKIVKLSKKMASSLLMDSENYKDHRPTCKDKEKSAHKLQEEVERDWLQQAEVLHYRLECSHTNATPQLKHNPWSLKCHQQHLQRMKENAKHRNQYKFILLENLTWRHTVPCVLDLKMGTRQHGDDASEEKKAMQIRKCQQSTSALIGVRLCGMQVYQPDTGQLMFMNKYHGRKLTLSSFKEALFQFFYSGRRLRHELLSPVLRRLCDMKTTLEDCESYRFFSSSLLIIYDGAAHVEQMHRRTEDRLSEEEDDDEEVHVQNEEYKEAQAGALSFASTETSSTSHNVDVRMIDFAHTTCKHYGEDSVVHEGQDSGYIFGLQNLITIISELEDHSTNQD
ncbi:inositol hexakisphosphate kinase 2-like [Boleophthalmus pectinirostris]|uniref:inositol hexakisphosphate kinase 2-like n=1 Tax=Boleophthalmus pectinirostris TaxID=150288 RepID=UPI00242CE375|nr:inositol hexakisphosphate kinase 2-like [Boleophthalmus pectinirostris]